MNWWQLAQVASFLILVPVTAAAQEFERKQAPVSVGLSMQRLVPTGVFRESIGSQSWKDQATLGADVIFHLTESGLVNLRLDYQFGSYARNKPCLKWTLCVLSYRNPSVGPELAVPRGPFRPYVTAAYGRDTFNGFTQADGTKASTGTNVWIYGGGVRIPIGATRRWSLDFGIRQHSGGTASYPQGTSTEQSDGSFIHNTTRSNTPLRTFNLGFQFRQAKIIQRR